MTTEEALLAAIWASPHDDLPRLVYADWLDETGDPAKVARAEFIRVQCELAKMPGDDPRYDTVSDRQVELEERHGKGWKAAMPSGAKYGHFDRGFLLPSLERFGFDGLLKVKAEKLRAAPLWRYHYGMHWEQAARLLEWPPVERFAMFSFHAPVPDGWAGAVADCPRLGNVSQLHLSSCQPADDELLLILDAWANRRLTHLGVNTVNLRGTGYRALAAHAATAKLWSLSLSGRRDQRVVLTDLFGRPDLDVLTDLSLYSGDLTPADVDALLNWPGFHRLRYLNLYSVRLGDDFAVRLAADPNSASLRRLMLGSNNISPVGARALAESPHLSHNLRLSLFDNPAIYDSSVQKLLRRRFRKS